MAARSLTKGERRVFLAYVTEETHELAAAKLEISTQTLKNHLGSIYKKVGVRKAHAAIYKLALEAGCDPLADPDEPSETVTQAGGEVVTSFPSQFEASTLTSSGSDRQNVVDEAAD